MNALRTKSPAQPVVYKPTGTVQISNRFSLIERKLLNAFLYDAQRKDFPEKEQSLSVTDAFSHIGLAKSRNQRVIKEAILSLVSTTIEWNGFGADRVQEWGACTFLAGGRIRGGRVYYQINPMISSKIKNPSLFAKIQLLIQAQISHRHALVLYEFLIDSLCRQQIDEMVVKGVPLPHLLKLTGLSETAYAAKGSFKTFNRDVLKKSLKDINDHTDLHVHVTPVRSGRRVTAFDFHVKRNKAYQVLLELDATITNGDEPEGQGAGQRTRASSSRGIAEFGELLALLLARGISEMSAKKLVADYPAERVRANLELVDKKMHEGRIKRQGAYLTTAIKEDYASAVDVPSVAKARVCSSTAAVTPTRSGEDDTQYREAWSRERGKRALMTFDALVPTKRQALETEYLAERRPGTAVAAFDSGGFDNPLVRADFSERFLAAKLLRGKHALPLSAYAEHCRQAERSSKTTARPASSQRAQLSGRSSNTVSTLSFSLIDED